MTKKGNKMTKEELYKEFLEVTHFDESYVESYSRIKRIKVGDVLVAEGFEGLQINIRSVYFAEQCITYFHKD